MSIFRNESDEKEIILVCDCGLPEHQIKVCAYDDEVDEFISFSPMLVTWKGFFRRLVDGLKYAFGYKSRYGQFDEILLSRDDVEKLVEYLKGFLNAREM